MASESEYLAPLILFEKGQIARQIIYSNIEIVEQQHYVFDSLWNKAIPAEQRIREIEEGVKPDVIETIRDPYEVQKIAFNLVKSCRAKILGVFSRANAFLRQIRIQFLL